MSTLLQQALPLANAGHVVVDLAVYLGPVLAVAAWLKLSTWREGRIRRVVARTCNAATPRTDR